jgi:crotonobetainyl-CoA:carnitine CoA-transferase CaiB-like acyl-CoA transferase
MGLAIAALHETPPHRAHTILAYGPKRLTPPPVKPFVLDLTALWAGPLAAHLLWLAGAEVVRVENPNRPDRMRDSNPRLYARLNQGKASVTLDPRISADRAALLALIARADIIIESARPRALYQLGIDASALIKAKAGQVWINITAHGASGDAANWVGFGDDCAVAGGLSAALLQATGKLGFVGDAIGDPLTGIYAARTAWQALQRRKSARIGIAISGVVAKALRETCAQSPTKFTETLRAWGKLQNPLMASEVETPYPPRTQTIAMRPLGADNSRYLPC